MIQKEIRGGLFLRCVDGDSFTVNVDTKFDNSGIIEPFLELSISTNNGRSLSELNGYYENIKGRLSNPLTNNIKPFSVVASYVVDIDGTPTNVIQNLTGTLLNKRKQYPLLDIYTDVGQSLRNLIGEKPYNFPSTIKLSVELNNITHTQTKHLEIIFHENHFVNDLSIII